MKANSKCVTSSKPDPLRASQTLSRLQARLVATCSWSCPWTPEESAEKRKKVRQCFLVTSLRWWNKQSWSHFSSLIQFKKCFTTAPPTDRSSPQCWSQTRWCRVNRSLCAHVVMVFYYHSPLLTRCRGDSTGEEPMPYKQEVTGSSPSGLRAFCFLSCQKLKDFLLFFL